MKYIQQLDLTDCGAACFAMIASYFGIRMSIAEIRQVAGTDTVGTNFKGLVEAASKYGLKSKPVKGDASSITTKTPVPFIAHLHNENLDNNSWNDHFVVVKRITKDRIEVWDPDPLVKKNRMTYKCFLEKWTGYALFLEPDYRFKYSKKNENLLLKFLPLFLPHKINIFFSFIASILIIVAGLLCSFYYKYIFDEVIYSKAENTLITLSLGILVVVIFKIIIEAVRSVFLSHFAFKIDLQLNFSYLNHVFKLPISFFETRKSGEILSRMDDLNKVKEILSRTILSGSLDILMVIVSGPILWNISSDLAMLSFFSVILVSFISVCFSKIYRKYYIKIMGENSDLQSFLFESINGISTIKALNAENNLFINYEKKKMKLNESAWKVNNYSIIHSFMSGFVDSCSGILIFWIGAFYIIKGEISFGTLITFNSLLAYFTGPIIRLFGIQNSIQEALIAAERVGEILELNWEQQEIQNNLRPALCAADITVKDITFRYGTRLPVYENMSLSIKNGEWTGIVGPSGSGKSTLVKLLLKFYGVEKGEVKLGDVNIKSIDTKYLRQSIGYVPQDIFLFSGSISENIALHHPDSSFDDIVNVSKKVGAHDFIEKLPNGYKTVLGEHGGGLSGGEKQRIAFARALLGNPSIMILDEATSNLDMLSENLIHDLIGKLRDEKLTVIIIAHRLSTVKNCDKIIVMEDGKVIEEGKHLELIRNNKLYAKMWNQSNM